MKRFGWIVVWTMLTSLATNIATAEGRAVFVNLQGGQKVHFQRHCETLGKDAWASMQELSQEEFSVSGYNGYLPCEVCCGNENPVTSLSGLGQWGIEGAFYPLWKMEGKDWKECVASERYVDLTHDGFADRLEILVFPDEQGRQPEEIMNGTGLAFVKVFAGKDDGSFAEIPLFISRGYTGAHAGNGILLLLKKDGKAYLVNCDFYEGMGEGNYGYSVYWLNDGTGISVVEERKVQFRMKEGAAEGSMQLPLRDETLPAFWKQLRSWIGTAEVLINAHTEMPPIIADWDTNRPAIDIINEVSSWDW